MRYFEKFAEILETIAGAGVSMMAVIFLIGSAAVEGRTLAIVLGMLGTFIAIDGYLRLFGKGWNDEL